MQKPHRESMQETMTVQWPYVEVSEQLEDGDMEGVKAFYAGTAEQVRDFDGVVPAYVESIVEVLASLQPRSVFEFGCNAGRNLAHLRKFLPAARLSGTDVNAAAIAHGRARYGLEIEQGDEHTLARLATDCLDVSFTVSVLDHIVFPQQTVRELVRVSRDFVLIFEIVHERCGKITRMTSHTGEVVPGYPFSYFHDYPQLFASAGAWKVLEVSMPAFIGNLGEFYRLMLFSKHSMHIGRHVVRSLKLRDVASLRAAPA
jgi:SAM-dependent methyltransferase